ncbi:ABC transporter ATP-binding protein [Alkaliphilus transvaalensis]|uniref:ABC transporter ATP-binding protein n=1 Tax=Alkaliphilus transvaalensis TaxID=114628 RepID=UPI00047DF8B4|nr:ABC transporter ATP-binding protein [Alkaliphilus transvaalensis]
MGHFSTLKYFFVKNKWYYFWGIIWLLLVDVFQLIIPEILRRFTDQLQENTLTRSDLLRYGGYILLIGIGIGFFRFLWRIFIIGTSRRLEYELRNKLFSHLLSLSTNYYTHNKTGDLMAHATNDINAVRMALGMGVVMMTDAVFITVVAITMMARTTDYRLTLLALIPLPILAVSIGRFGKVIHRRFKAVQEAISTLTDTVQENFSGIRVVKSFVQEEDEVKKFNEKNHNLFQKNMGLVKLYGLFHPFIQFVSALSFIIVVGYGGMLVIYGDISLGDFIAFNSYLSLLVWPVMAIGWVINVMQRGTASMERLNKIFSETPEIIEDSKAISLDHFRGNIEFKQVTFKYPNSHVNALENFSIKIPEGRSLGVIGKTGSGKSSIANLILRLYDVDEGNILIDGHPIEKLQLASLRQHIGYVDQDSFLFSTTISENIAFGIDKYTQLEVEEAAKLAEVHDNIIDFPKKYDTYVGERGVTLSGGQKQRVSIARSLVKKPQVLILDDSLSAVDTDTEERILKSLKTEMRGKTNIIIAHRISTIKDCDEIIVLEEGKILEQGTHEALLENRKQYYELYQKQLLEEKIASEH